MAVTAANLSTFGGIATVSLVHSLIPTHWLPFSVVGRVQKWTIHQTLSITALGAFLHVLSTSILGFTAVTMAHTLAGEEAVEAIADASVGTMAIAVAVLLACTLFVMLTLVALSFYGASQVSLARLVLMFRAVFCGAARLHANRHAHSRRTLLLWGFPVAVLLACTLFVILALVALSFSGASQVTLGWLERYKKLAVMLFPLPLPPSLPPGLLSCSPPPLPNTFLPFFTLQVKFGWLERYEKLVVGVILCAVGILTHLFHHHDHPHGHHSHGHAGHAGSVFAPGHTDIITAGTMLSHHH
ncbi:unnamed protein product [Closterium sp. Naga37s-1]|nr:unnamed protein product [Closterium sp. Naga37s-1]